MRAWKMALKLSIYWLLIPLWCSSPVHIGEVGKYSQCLNTSCVFLQTWKKVIQLMNFIDIKKDQVASWWDLCRCAEKSSTHGKMIKDEADEVIVLTFMRFLQKRLIEIVCFLEWLVSLNFDYLIINFNE